MRTQLRPAVVLLLALTMMTGVVYPALVTAVARVAMPSKAGGSVIERDGRAVGSSLIGQPFSDPRYFWPRPSATSPSPYNAAAGSGSNLAPSNPALAKSVAERVGALKAADPSTAPVPVDLVTSSGSGLDPHISPASAYYQAERVARARGMAPDAVRRLIDEYTESRTFGVLGEQRVNVLGLNLALDRAAMRKM
jgi:K+-transporting ATPase ATPase C chain